MVWRESKNFIFSVVLFVLCVVNGAGQTADSTSVWTNQHWNDAKSGIEYVNKEKKKIVEADTTKIDPILDDEPSPFWEKVAEFLQSPSGKIVLVTLAIAVLLTMILRMMGFRGLGGNARVNSDLNIMIQSLEDDITAGPVAGALDIALRNGDYKSAVRLSYLSALQQLHQREIIQWKKDKTNAHYIAEIKNQRIASTFSKVTYAYEVVWYGDRNIDETAYQTIQTLTSTLTKELIEISQ